LPFSTEVNGVSAMDIPENVANLDAVEARPLRNTKIGAVLKTGKAKLVRQPEVRDRGGLIVRERRDLVQESVHVEENGVDLRR